MKIVSENKKKVINFDTADKVYVEGKELLAKYDNEIILLKKYESEEKAQEILDGIIRAFSLGGLKCKTEGIRRELLKARDNYIIDLSEE